MLKRFLAALILRFPLPWLPRGPRMRPRRSMATCSGWPKSSAPCTICAASAAAMKAPKWRNEMQALIDAETPSGDRRARMIAGFNRGYNGFQQTYRTCTPAASVAIRRYIEEGSKISRDLTARYAN